MPKSLTVSYLVPVENILFMKWLPEKVEEAIQAETEIGIVKIQIDRDCVEATPDRKTDEYLARWMNIQVSKLKVQILIGNVEDELANFIFDERAAPRKEHYGIGPDDEKYQVLKDEYVELDRKIANSINIVINRFIAYARNTKGQFWLEEFRLDVQWLSSRNNSYEAKAKLDDGDWFRWCPLHEDVFNIRTGSDEIIFKLQDWKDVQQVVNRGSRPNLVHELSANAKSLFTANHFRSAVIEAVTALEVAVNDFAANPRIESLVDFAPGRASLENLKNRVEHLKFSTSVMFLIPLLIDSETLPQQVLDNAIQAIQARNILVHKGQRSISEAKARQHVESTLQLCQILVTCTYK
jgi:hypothetical protein